MLQTNFYFPSIFNPTQEEPDIVISNFVIRLKEFNELMTSIRSDKMENPPQHYIVQGQRGYGKTTLLYRLKIEISRDDELNKWLIPVLFDEEQYSVRTLAKFWEEIIDILENEYEMFQGLTDSIESLYEKANPEEEIFNFLINSLSKYNKKVVLLLDNFGDMVGKFSRKEHQRLREVLITCNYIRIIGASSDVLEFYFEYKEPFFDFFKIIILDELDKEETILLLRRLGETYKADEINKIIEEQPQRIEALRRITGGVPRTIVLLFEIFLDDIDGHSIKDLERILDRVTPLYKHRLDNLSIQQQAIIDAIAQNWDSVSTKEIAQKVRMSSKAVSSQLNQLEKNQLIRKIPTSKKNHLYQINERFFNIYYLMRLGKRKNRNKVIWLVRFFEIWCSQTELLDRVNRHLKALRENRLYEKHALYISQALSQTSIPIKLQDELIKETRQYLSVHNCGLLKELKKSKIEIFEEAIKKDDVSAMFNLALMYCEEFKDFNKAEKYYLMAIEKNDIDAMFNLALLYENELKDFKKAEKYYLMAIEKDDVSAMYNLALMYDTELKEIKNAEKYYLLAVEKGHVSAMYNLALMYQKEFNDFKKAEKYYLMAVKKGDIEAIYNLALLYQEKFKDLTKAEKYYLMAVGKDYVKAMYNLAFLYEKEFKNFNKAEEYYLMAIEKDDVRAMVNLALIYETEFKDFNKAENYYLMAIKRNDADAMYNLAILYENELKDINKAEKYYLMAVEKDHFTAMNNLAHLYFIQKKHKVKSLELQKTAYESNEIKYSYGYILTLLWNNLIEEGIKLFKELFINEEFLGDIESDANDFLLMFIAKKQYNFIYNLFNDNPFDIKDKYKPIYYALLAFMGKEYEDELKKMGPELKETVDEIIKEIKQTAIDYV